MTGHEARALAELQARNALRCVDQGIPYETWLADQLMRFRAEVLMGYHCACCGKGEC